MSTSTTITSSTTNEQELLVRLEAEFDGFRSRIAKLSMNACGVVTGMYSPLAPIELSVIDIADLEMTSAPAPALAPAPAPIWAPAPAPALASAPASAPAPTTDIDLSWMQFDTGVEQVELERVTHRAPAAVTAPAEMLELLPA